MNAPTDVEMVAAAIMLAIGVDAVTLSARQETELRGKRLLKETLANGDVRLRLEEEN